MERKQSMMVFGAKAIHSLIITGCCALMLVGSINEANAAAADLMHSSANLGTKYGTWGAAFTCGTCHAKNTGNIKRIKGTIETKTVVANNVTGYGDDSDARGAGNSNRVCEVCHTQTAYHRITTTSTPTLTHNNNSDCSSCHKHNQAFKASCDDCHGGEATNTTPIATNAHSKHILTSAGNYGLSCGICHPVDHDGIVEVAFTGIGAGGSYSGAVTKQCSNLYCHGTANTADWDAGTGGACGDCHGAATTGRPNVANEPAGGSHTTGSHAAAACTVCHAHDGSNTSLHVNGPANSFGDAEVSTAGTGITTYTAPSATLASSPDPDGFKYGDSNCTVTCHGNASWGAAGGCNFCHGAADGRAWPDGIGGNYFDSTAGAHDNHVLAIGTYLGYGDYNTTMYTDAEQQAVCAFCHPNPGATGHDADGGADSRVDMLATGSFLKYTGAGASAVDSGSAYNNTTFGCSNLSCHNDIATPTGANNWNAPPAAPTCALCHTSAGGTLRHDVHVTTKGYACIECHTNVGTFPGGTGAPLRHADGLVQLVWTNSSFENTYGGGAVTYSQTAPLPYKDATWGTCASAACHNNKTTPAWNAAAGSNCAICHTDVTADATHTSHTGAAATFGRTINCASCHEAATAWNSAPPATGHINGTFAVAGNVTFTYTGTYPTKGTCNTNVCHNSGTNTAPNSGVYNWGTPLAAGCNNCHLTTPTSNAHNEHMSNGYAGAACSDCHTAATVTTHMNGNVNLDATKATYSRTASVAVGGVTNGTCSTANCHNRGATGQPAQSIAWNVATGTVAGTTDLTCDSCHGDATAGLTPSHGDHITAGKACTICHSVLTTTLHISKKTGGLVDGSVASAGEAAVAIAGTTAYTWSSPTCTNTSNNGLGCHATGTPSWGTAFASTACAECHTNTTTTAVNPTSGLHNVTPSVSGQRHDGTIAGSCAACHTVPTFSTHKDGTFDSNGFVAANKTAMGLGTMYTATADNTGSCATTTCHIAGTGGNGSSDDWAHQWESTAGYYTTNTTACEGCHGDKTSGWNTGVIHRAGGTITTHGGTNTYGCKDCHGLEATSTVYTFTWNTNDWGGTSKHGNGVIEINSNGATYSTTTNLCATCHTATGADGIHNFVDTGYSIASINADTVTVSCVNCHVGSGGGALNVSSASSHVFRGNKAGYNTFSGCENCHPMHTGGVLVPNNSTVGINYTASGRTGFRLGGNATTGTTEADICWNCHYNMTYQAAAVSEWGQNNNATTGSSPYDYGTLDRNNWNGATWTSGKATEFAYKTGLIQSTHSVNATSGSSALTSTTAYAMTETPDADSVIRCSYCHDVHNTAGIAGDVSGPPYLRGGWMGNPYEEDGAPRASFTGTGGTYYGNVGNPGWGAVPRGSVNSNKLGGYWIDQNNVTPGTTTAAKNPTSGWTVAQHSGLCTLCHTGGIDTLDIAGNSDPDIWVSTGNGHQNAVLGGSGTAAAGNNIFDARGGTATNSWEPLMHWADANRDPRREGFGFRINSTSTARYQPYIDNGADTEPLLYKTNEWAVDMSGTTTDSQYHQFSCSKCHNPHASRLPKLMITNCLDTKHNTWDAQYQLGGANTGGKTFTTGVNYQRELANFTSAQNCHRYGGLNTLVDPNENRAGDQAGTGAGWNKVTPWMKANTTP